MPTKSHITDAPFRPSDFMRSYSPDLFSDSREASRPQLAREAFEYRLETLTSRKEEIKFEYFARKLAEKEICPNLLPQTGPTGGGDSKVDAETYPVSPSIALRWYVGIDQSAAHERWAFAISAKKKWKPKLKSDVETIVGANRGYARIFFITNQFVAAELRGATRRRTYPKVEHSRADPRPLLDRREGIRERSHRSRRETLDLSEFASVTRIKGSRDVQREEALRLLDAQIEDVPRYAGVPYQLAEDCLLASTLARDLERPRAEVDGRFARQSGPLKWSAKRRSLVARQ
jgi:hypothetical protein